MPTIRLQVNPQMCLYLENATTSYNTVGEYIRELIREDMKKSIGLSAPETMTPNERAEIGKALLCDTEERDRRIACFINAKPWLAASVEKLKTYNERD